MAGEERIFPGANLAGFDEVARDRLDGMLATYGFKVEMSKVETSFAMRRYRNGPRYITVEARSHPKESPCGKVKLGTGNAEWPESDWNHAPLWRMVKSVRPEAVSGDYGLDNVRLDDFFEQIAKDLQHYAMTFLGSDLTIFRKVRAEAATERAPYEVAPGGPYNEGSLNFAKLSKALKEKYSSEEAA